MLHFHHGSSVDCIWNSATKQIVYPLITYLFIFIIYFHQYGIRNVSSHNELLSNTMLLTLLTNWFHL